MHAAWLLYFQISAGQDYGEAAVVFLMVGGVAAWLVPVVVLTAIAQVGKAVYANYSYVAGHLRQSMLAVGESPVSTGQDYYL